MPYFMDRHDLPDATSDDVASAHLQDLEVQNEFGVRFLSYWFDYDRHTAFCLVDAPDRELAHAVHARSHGFLPAEIIPVDQATVEMFLGRVVDPAESGTVRSAFRVVMFTDLVESTDLTQRVGDVVAMAILRTHDSIIRAALEGHHGTEIKHTGDGIMASFVSVTDALNCAIGIQRSVAQHTRGASSSDEGLALRIGIAAGEPVTEAGDLFGATVQLASRLCASASPEEVCVSGTVSELAIGKQFSFGSSRELVLKGFSHPVRAATLFWSEM